MSDMLSPLADLRHASSRHADLASAAPLVRAEPERFSRPDGRTLDLRTLDLHAMVEGEVVPRLHAALTSIFPSAPSADVARAPVRHRSPAERSARGEVVALARRMLADDLDGACRRVAVLRAGGQSLEAVFQHVLAPTARHLRDLWSDDLCGLADVTLALCNLRTLLRRHAVAFGADGPETGRRALLVSAAPAGDTDIGLALFELTMAAQFLRRDGWQPRVECGLSHPAVRDAARREWFDVVAILVPDAGHPDRARCDVIASGIRVIRRDAPNPAMAVIACGPAFARSPDLAGRVGAARAACDPLALLAPAALPSVRDDAAAPGRRERAS